VWLVADMLKSKQAAGSSLEIRKEHTVLQYAFFRVIVVCGNFLVAISCCFVIVIYPTQPFADTCGRK